MMEAAGPSYLSPKPGAAEESLHSSRKRKYSSSSDAPPREYGLMRDTGRNDTSRFVGSASGIHFIRSVYLRLLQKSAVRGEASQSIENLVPGEDDQIQPGPASRADVSTRLWSEQEVAPGDSTADGPLPSFEQLVRWSHSYFELWHPTLPFLNAGEVLKIFEKVVSSGIASLSHHEQSITRSVLSISLADSRQSVPFDQPLPPSLVFHTIEEAISSSHFTLYQPASLPATQAALSIQLFLISMLRLNAASRLGGLIVRMAFHLGLHRCPSRYPFFTKDEANIRRRVFWSLYCNERFLSQSLGLPLDIKDDDVDVCFPGEELHSAEGETEDHRLKLLTYLSKHARVRGLILELRNKSMFSRDSKPVNENKVRVEMGRWSNDIQDAVEGEDSDDEQHELDDNSHLRLSAGHRLYLLVLKFEAQISLNRPMMAGGPSNDSWSQGLQNCISAARCILTALRKHQARNPVAGQDDTKLNCPIIWPTITWAIWISSFILIYAASERQLPLTSALRHIDAGKNMLRHIAARQTAWPEYCLSAINTMTAALRDVPDSTQGQGDAHPRILHRQRSSHSQPRRSSMRQENYQAMRQNIAASQSEESPTLSTPTVFPTTIATSSGLPEDVQAGLSHSRDGVESMPARHMRPRATSAGSGTDIYPAQSLRPSSEMRNNQQPDSVQSLRESGPAPTATSSGSYIRLQQQAMDPVTGDPGQFVQNEEFSMREGDESLVWYEQLFSHSLGAIDFPYMAAAQFDPSVDPTWEYLR